MNLHLRTFIPHVGSVANVENGRSGTKILSEDQLFYSSHITGLSDSLQNIPRDFIPNTGAHSSVFCEVPLQYARTHARGYMYE
jgi:hypothetical protein